jgi:hypothetical protein
MKERVEMCVPFKYIYFLSALFVISCAWLRSVFVYYRQKSIIANEMYLSRVAMLLITYCTTPLYSSISSFKYVLNKSSGATALQGFGRQRGLRRSAKLVPTYANRGMSCGQRNGSPRPLISVYRTWIATYFIQVAPQLSWRCSRVYPVPDPLPLRKSGSAGNRTRDFCICSQKLWPLDHRGGP